MRAECSTPLYISYPWGVMGACWVLHPPLHILPLDPSCRAPASFVPQVGAEASKAVSALMHEKRVAEAGHRTCIKMASHCRRAAGFEREK